MSDGEAFYDDYEEFEEPDDWYDDSAWGGGQQDNSDIEAPLSIQPGTHIRATQNAKSGATLGIFCTDAETEGEYVFLTVRHLYSRRPKKYKTYRISSLGNLEPFGYMWRAAREYDAIAIRVHPSLHDLCSGQAVSLAKPFSTPRQISGPTFVHLAAGHKASWGHAQPPLSETEEGIVDLSQDAILPMGGHSGGTWYEPVQMAPVGMQTGLTSHPGEASYADITTVLEALSLNPV